MNNIILNGATVTYNNIYYISETGDDTIGDGSIGKPFATYDKAFTQALSGDLIYFIKGNYNITSLTTSEGSFIYDRGKELIIYGEKDTYITMNNSSNPSRDTHAINIYNANTKVIGFIIDYNITNKSPNYSRSVFGQGDYMRGYVYNCHFIIRSATSFSYANTSNVMKCVNCQFDILVSPETAYSGKTTFEKCTFTISGLATGIGMSTASIDNKYSVSYDDNYNVTPIYEGYGISYGEYEWRLFIYLIEQADGVYCVKSSFYKIGQVPITNTMINDYGCNHLSVLTQNLNVNSILMNDDGAVGVGKQFSCSLNDEILSLNSVIT